MWRLKIAEGGGPWLRTLNNFGGRQVWEYDEHAGDAAERLAVDKERATFAANRFEQRHSSDLLMRLQDVVKAYILGYEKPEAEGRHIICERVMHYGDLAALLKKLFPQHNIEARESESAQPRASPYIVSTKKLNELGVETQPLEEVLHPMVESFKEHKFMT